VIPAGHAATATAGAAGARRGAPVPSSGARPVPVAVSRSATGSDAGSASARVTVFSRPGCHLCDEAMDRLQNLREELGFALEERDITTDETLLRAYFERIPVIALDGQELCDYFLDEGVLRERLESRR
jgi:glutaredoxin